MNKLFLIDGAAGAGKSDLISFVKKYMNNYDINVIPKITTRKVRTQEEAKDSDLSFITEQEFEKWEIENLGECYTYPYGDGRYGFSKTELIESVQNHEFTLVIVRNKALIHRIQDELRDIVYVRHIYIYTDMGLAVKRLREEGFDDQAINLRLYRNEQLWTDYVDILDDNVIVIINNSNKNDFHRKIQVLMKKYLKENERKDMLYINPSTQFELITPLIGYKDKLQRQLKRYPYEKNVFLMMKFRDNNLEFYKFTPLYNYYK